MFTIAADIGESVANTLINVTKGVEETLNDIKVLHGVNDYKHDLKLGDHVYVWGNLTLHQHHGIITEILEKPSVTPDSALTPGITPGVTRQNSGANTPRDATSSRQPLPLATGSAIDIGNLSGSKTVIADERLCVGEETPPRTDSFGSSLGHDSLGTVIVENEDFYGFTRSTGSKDQSANKERIDKDLQRTSLVAEVLESEEISTDSQKLRGLSPNEIHLELQNGTEKSNFGIDSGLMLDGAAIASLSGVATKSTANRGAPLDTVDILTNSDASARQIVTRERIQDEHIVTNTGQRKPRASYDPAFGGASYDPHEVDESISIHDIPRTTCFSTTKKNSIYFDDEILDRIIVTHFYPHSNPVSIEVAGDGDQIQELPHTTSEHHPSSRIEITEANRNVQPNGLGEHENEDGEVDRGSDTDRRSDRSSNDGFPEALSLPLQYQANYSSPNGSNVSFTTPQIISNEYNVIASIRNSNLGGSLSDVGITPPPAGSRSCGVTPNSANEVPSPEFGRAKEQPNPPGRSSLTCAEIAESIESNRTRRTAQEERDLESASSSTFLQSIIASDFLNKDLGGKAGSRNLASIHQTTLRVFMGSKKLKVARYGCEPWEVLVKRSGTCYPEKSDRVEKVLTRARLLREARRTQPYDFQTLMRSNCEHVAFFCKTGIWRSRQVELLTNVNNLVDAVSTIPGATINAVGSLEVVQSPINSLSENVMSPTYENVIHPTYEKVIQPVRNSVAKNVIHPTIENVIHPTYENVLSPIGGAISEGFTRVSRTLTTEEEYPNFSELLDGVREEVAGTVNKVAEEIAAVDMTINLDGPSDGYQQYNYAELHPKDELGDHLMNSGDYGPLSNTYGDPRFENPTYGQNGQNIVDAPAHDESLPRGPLPLDDSLGNGVIRSGSNASLRSNGSARNGLAHLPVDSNVNSAASSTVLSSTTASLQSREMRRKSGLSLNTKFYDIGDDTEKEDDVELVNERKGDITIRDVGDMDLNSDDGGNFVMVDAVPE